MRDVIKVKSSDFGICFNQISYLLKKPSVNSCNFLNRLETYFQLKIPVLVIHDKTDGDVPVSCAYKIRQNLEKGSLLITSELGHTKILRNQEVIKKSINFIKQNT